MGTLPAAATGAVLFGTVTPAPNTATLLPGADAAAGESVETNELDGTELTGAAAPNGCAAPPFGTDGPLPNTATMGAGALAGVAAGSTAVDDVEPAGNVEVTAVRSTAERLLPPAGSGLADETLPAGSVGLTGGAAGTLGAAEPAGEMVTGSDISLAARSTMPSPLKSAATTFRLRVEIWERFILIDRLVRVSDCA